MATIGFVGTGIMGLPMAMHLLKAGHHIKVWNRTLSKADSLKEAGAQVCSDLEQVGKDVEFLICMLSDGKTCDEILFKEHGAISQLKPESTVMVMSSIPVEVAQAQSEKCRERGFKYLDAPVSGGEKGAKNASLAIMVGGEAKTFSQAETILSAMGRPILVGGAGCGMLAKLVNQMIVATTIATVSEGLLLATKAGADPIKLKQALTGGFADSPILQQHGERMLSRNFKPGGTARNQHKDIHTAVSYAKSLELNLPVAQQVSQLFENMLAAGDGELDHSGLIRELERMNPV
ncbi:MULTISPECIES: NAD(P)-dependent oxidoreductase [Acinetobacter calcoaceticus/baumannii complex]|jgi:2-hydroxy-3-oxopropionate reductase|uniref:NAD(P)-dependent oxidoreductase n=1 Tax=Acinetobacter pittii TaxID=48296 RepID=A0AAE9MDD7_ACIPI|nr:MULTISPECIES: NAD(P)-dependent oxidoreductase [Acinetobacter calcoaceticus/baumannii complex]AZP29369.1 NAD(P)-dependent oxidoreductase [Acinetobacter pittii]EXS12098.1 NAD binding domain of 6-phosphogluconate dehydrogenase family protein [Acinetobacter sp. 883425]MBK0412414.1 NAD(P)-dependent oxidoreductase [Acinetobacter pittii]MBK1418495.1 NAD(P)-dependent oxidoreductase [Acinetobacter pittii]MCM5531268.1 NAD(P)-dependent oxidoreductase [Acinetobacter pittii]